MSSDTALLIAGLGNPGDRYARNRHNAGFIVADEIHAHYRFGPWKAKFEAFLSEGTLAGRKVFLLKPQTYMNNSGVSVGAALRFFKLKLPALVVIHDEIDLAAGKTRSGARRNVGHAVAYDPRARQINPHAVASGQDHSWIGFAPRMIGMTQRLFSVGVVGARHGAVTKSGAGKARRSSLPFGVSGNASSTIIAAGTM